MSFQYKHLTIHKSEINPLVLTYATILSPEVHSSVIIYATFGNKLSKSLSGFPQPCLSRFTYLSASNRVMLFRNWLIVLELLVQKKRETHDISVNGKVGKVKSFAH